MAEAIVECTQTYLGTHRVVAGTRAAVLADLGQSVKKLRITEWKKGTELLPGEIYEVPAEDLRFWKPVPS